MDTCQRRYLGQSAKGVRCWRDRHAEQAIAYHVHRYRDRDRETEAEPETKTERQKQTDTQTDTQIYTYSRFIALRYIAFHYMTQLNIR